MKPLLVTSALPYANGPIHLGHLVEYIQTDIWVRYWRLRGRDVVYICADDTHGTPIMLRAQAEGIEPEELIRRVWQEHRRDFAGFRISFDHYYTTHSPENRALASEIYGVLLEQGHIVERPIEQAYCNRCAMFLPDRYIRGVCPACGATEQYGDSCEACSGTHEPRALLRSYCANCRSAPVWRTSSHLFFRLADFAGRLSSLIDGGFVQREVANQLQEWFEQGLKDWDISRDAPYFGFEIPDRPGKYFYVWLDAPVGYIASTLNYCNGSGIDFNRYWRGTESEVVHFIGKDIIYFHALFWPAMLLGSGFRTPTRLVVHGFLTVNGEKMSKTRGTFITAETYLRHLDPQHLRWYYATKLTGRVEDIDLRMDDFVRRTNSDLVHKIANIPSRTLAILHQYCGGCLGRLDEAGRALVTSVLTRRHALAALYESCDFAEATRVLVELATEINGYLEQRRPWVTASDHPVEAAATCTAALNAFRILATLAQPILPGFSTNLDRVLGLRPTTWASMGDMVEDRPVGRYERLIGRVPDDAIRRVAAEAHSSVSPSGKPDSTQTPALGGVSSGLSLPD